MRPPKAKTKSAIRNAIVLLQNGWCRGYEARTSDATAWPCEASDPQASSWSLAGALKVSASADVLPSVARAVLKAMLPDKPWRWRKASRFDVLDAMNSFSSYNDHHSTTLPEVIEWLKKALRS